MNTKVKICGIRTLEQAFFSYKSGADYIGLQFVPISKRKIDFQEAKKVSIHLKGKINLVGVFQNQSINEINKISKKINLDYVQLHGNENAALINKITLPIIKSFCLQANFDASSTIESMKKYPVRFYLIDREKRGEGKMLSLENSAILSKSFPIFFAGGLTPQNVIEVVKKVKPYAVDVASGIETDGIFDFEKVQLFIKHSKQ
ncbi:MAG: phosphoribosylanthranilate isomerase [bacterium]|nr:phosphoribosylanthranilate isomerase [bacterium]